MPEDTVNQTKQNDEKKEVAKEEVKKEEEEAKNAEEKTDDKAEKTDKDKKDDEKVEAKKEPVVPKPTVHKIDYKPDIVYLYQLTRTPVIPSICPYCLKVETWLRLAGLSYENVNHRMKYKSKKGQLPFVELNGGEIADSTLIIKDLGQRNNIDLDEGLSSEQKNVAHAHISMIENHFAWVIKFWRTKNPGSMLTAYKMDLQHITEKKWPKLVLEFIFKLKFRRVAKKVRAHGIGVHTPEEIEEFGHSDLNALSDLLGDKPFFFGDNPTSLDVVAFANVAQVVYMDKEVTYNLREWLFDNCSNLVDFCNRMKERAFPDWEEMCTNLDLNSHLPKPPKEEEKKEEEKKDEKEKEQEGEKEKEDKKDEKEKDDSEKEKTQKDEKEDDNKKAEEKKEKEK